MVSSAATYILDILLLEEGFAGTKRIMQMDVYLMKRIMVLLIPWWYTRIHKTAVKNKAARGVVRRTRGEELGPKSAVLWYYKLRRLVMNQSFGCEDLRKRTHGNGFIRQLQFSITGRCHG